MTVTSLLAALALLIKRIRKMYTNTDYYKLKKIREGKRKQNKRREIELAELGFDQETNFIRTRPTAPPNSDDSDLQIELVSTYKKKRQVGNETKRKRRRKRTEH